MAKIICAFHGTGRVRLFHHLRQKKGMDVVLVGAGFTDAASLLCEYGNADVIIAPATPELVDSLDLICEDFDLVYPDPMLSPSLFTTAMALDGMQLQQIHRAIHNWRADLQKLQTFRDTNVNHIVLDEGQTLLDTHGINKDEQRN